MKTVFIKPTYKCKVHGDIGEYFSGFTNNSGEMIKYCSHCFHENVLMKNCEVLTNEEDLK